MKKAVLAGSVIIICMLIIPLININGQAERTRENPAVQTAAAAKEAVVKTGEEEIFFRVKTASGIEKISEEDYVTGVVAAEMPATYPAEALKAQSVAARTFALCRREQNRDKEYDLTDSYKTDQSYLSYDALKEKWQDKYEEKIAVIKQAVTGTAGEYLTFGGKPALTLYHALSAGVTNPAADVFGGDRPYLVSVDSQGDKLSPDYRSVFSFSEDELTARLEPIKKGSAGENLFSNIKTAEGGLVKQADYCGQTVRGSRICELLGLSSPAFTVEYVPGAYNFTCLGRGHGVGMSQYGAGKIAETGGGYREILAHYYPGTELAKK